jgi:hypothetical protein
MGGKVIEMSQFLREELQKSLKAEYFEKGVILTTKRSRESALVLKCDRGGAYRNKLISQVT